MTAVTDTLQRVKLASRRLSQIDDTRRSKVLLAVADAIEARQDSLLRANARDYWNIRVHGIHPEDTANAPNFPHVWQQLLPLLEETPILVAHNAAFDMTCIRRSLQLYGLDKPKADYFCSCLTARRIYDFPCNKLDYLCQQFEITGGTHHRAGDDAEMCARLFLRELKDMGYPSLEELGPYRKQL